MNNDLLKLIFTFACAFFVGWVTHGLSVDPARRTGIFINDHPQADTMRAIGIMGVYAKMFDSEVKMGENKDNPALLLQRNNGKTNQVEAEFHIWFEGNKFCWSTLSLDRQCVGQ